jgi:hypothetical protein
MSKVVTRNKEYLETWEFSSADWNTYVNTAKSLKKEDSIYMGIAFLILGIPFLMLVRNVSFITASFFVIPFAILIPWLRHKLSTSYLKHKQDVVLVNFYPDYILINDKKIELISKNRWIKNMKIIKDKNASKLLEIDVAWSTRRGDTFDEVRIPIPNNKLLKAEMLIEFYSRYK